jgi:hypothetical protein
MLTELRPLLESPTVKKYFVGHTDIDKMKIYHGIICRGCVDLQRVAFALLADVIPDVENSKSLTPFGGNLMAITAGCGRPKFEKCTDKRLCPNIDKVGRMWDNRLRFRDANTREWVYDTYKLDYAAYDAYAAYHTGRKFRILNPSSESLEEFHVANW